MKVFFIRHGESLANLNLTSSLFSNDRNNRLTNIGKKQIGRVAKTINSGVSIVYSSPMHRAIESAQEFLFWYDKETRFMVDDRLREIDYGIYTDNRGNYEMNEITRRQIAGDYEVRFGGGENKREIITRFFAFLIDCYDKHMDESIIVFSHGRAISMVESEFCKINHLEKQHIHTSNGAVKELDIDTKAVSCMQKRINSLNKMNQKMSA